MGPIFEDFSWENYLLTLEQLLRDTAQWLTDTWPGQVVLITGLVLLAVMFSANFGLAEDD